MPVCTPTLTVSKILNGRSNLTFGGQIMVTHLPEKRVLKREILACRFQFPELKVYG